MHHPSGPGSVPSSHHQEGEDFHEMLLDQVRKTPWFLLSIAFHLTVAIILSFLSTTPRAAPPEFVPLQVAEEVAPPPLLPEPPTENEPQEVDVPTPVDDPEMTPEDIDVPQDSPDFAPGEELDAGPVGEDSPFKNTGAIGLGPGAPGGGGGGGDDGLGHRRGRPRGQHTEGLAWLARHQSPDGRWDGDGFMRHGDPTLGPLCDGKGGAVHDVGLTGLALLAFLGAGHTHREGTYKNNVRLALKWLKAQQDVEGCVGARSAPQFVYGHAIAALALTEAYGMTRSAILREPAQRSINFVVQCQNPYKAWRYGVRPGDNDSSVTGWMVMALKSAQMSGLEVSETSMRWAIDFLNEMTDPETGRTGYTKAGEPPVREAGLVEKFPASQSESMTAVGILSRIFAGEDPSKSVAIKAGTELLLKRLPVWEPEAGRVDMYYWYYATLAMFQVGGSGWNQWNDRMKKAIVDTQRKDGNFAGSWDPVGPWGGVGGRVYSTALMTLCLEVYFRYGRVFGTR